MQNADILCRDKAAFDQANAKQTPDLLGVLRVVLISLYSFHSFGIGDDGPDIPLLQNIEHWNPILSC